MMGAAVLPEVEGKSLDDELHGGGFTKVTARDASLTSFIYCFGGRIRSSSGGGMNLGFRGAAPSRPLCSRLSMGVSGGSEDRSGRKDIFVRARGPGN